MTDDRSFLKFEEWFEFLGGDKRTRESVGISIDQQQIDLARRNESSARSSYRVYVRLYEDRTGIIVTPREARPALRAGLTLAVFALIAILPMPGWYYELLRSVLTVGSLLIGIIALRSLQFWWLVLPAAVITIWTPVPWFALDRSVWLVLDLAVAVVFVLAALLIPAPSETHDDYGKPIRYSEWWKFAIPAAIVALLSFGVVQNADENREFCASLAEEGLSCIDE